MGRYKLRPNGFSRVEIYTKDGKYWWEHRVGGEIISHREISEEEFARFIGDQGTEYVKGSDSS